MTAVNSQCGPPLDLEPALILSLSLRVTMKILTGTARSYLDRFRKEIFLRKDRSRSFYRARFQR